MKEYKLLRIAGIGSAYMVIGGSIGAYTSLTSSTIPESLKTDFVVCGLLFAFAGLVSLIGLYQKKKEIDDKYDITDKILTPEVSL